MSLIECRDISKTYVNGDVSTTVLRDINLKIDTGEFVAIIGPSGSGKSTLMHILGILDSPSTGSYHLAGQDVARLSDSELAKVRSRQIGFVFQSFNLLPRATVQRNVELPLMYSGVPRIERVTRAREALKAAGLTDKARYLNRSNQLSGGQMQRVAIARALINNPSLILADEPTGNLDQKTGAIVLETFQDLNRTGRTIILITHDQHVAQYARRIIHIRDGQIIEDVANKQHKSSIIEEKLS